MPIQNPAKLRTISVFGSHLDIHTKIETAIKALAAQNEIHSINVVRMATGNNYLGLISYETV